jgi:hypothetical protein
MWLVWGDVHALGQYCLCKTRVADKYGIIFLEDERGATSCNLKSEADLREYDTVLPA